jgi:hypothetical protein
MDVSCRLEARDGSPGDVGGWGGSSVNFEVAENKTSSPAGNHTPGQLSN